MASVQNQAPDGAQRPDGRFASSNSDAPSKSALAKATGISLLVALLLLFAFVLPAEYGFDPLKTGAALKLTGISQTEEPKKGAVATPAPGKSGVYRSEPKTYKVESEDFSLRPGEGMEMKYHMQKGAEMVYAWKADARLAYEFHGEPDQKPSKDYFESYELNDKVGADSSFGSFTAPSTGIHGWFWQNKTKKEVMFHLTVAGFFDSAKMMSGGSTDEMTIEDAK
jgi:hypothetical protein